MARHCSASLFISGFFNVATETKLKKFQACDDDKFFNPILKSFTFHPSKICEHKKS